jgi:RNA polymerase sigma-70 factor (ECF subfamily)
VLSKYQGLKYKEISEIIGCTEGAVKTKVFRAIVALKHIYLKLDE